MLDMTCLIATYNLSEIEIEKLLKNMNIFCPVILRNQCNYNKEYNIEIKGNKAEIICANDKGVSRNRNELLKRASSDYIYFCDDDEVFLPDCREIIDRNFNSIKNADAIAFNVNILNENRNYKKYDGKNKRCKIRDVISCGVWRFIFKRKSIKNIFDVRVGSGAKYPCGEDSIFIAQYLNQTKKVFITKETIASIEQKKSCWINKIGSDEYLYAKGYVYKIIYPKIYLGVIVRFLIKNKIFNLKNLNKVLSGYKKVTKDSL